MCRRSLIGRPTGGGNRPAPPKSEGPRARPSSASPTATRRFLRAVAIVLKHHHESPETDPYRYIARHRVVGEQNQSHDRRTLDESSCSRVLGGQGGANSKQNHKCRR